MNRIISSESRRLLADELAGVRGELPRIDAKAGATIGLDGAGLIAAATLAAAEDIPAVQRVLFVAAVLAFTASALVAVRTLRPRTGPTGVALWSTLSADQILSALDDLEADEHNAGELRVLAVVSATKFQQLQRAADILFAGVGLLALAVVAGVVFG